ncbi:MAG TPA: redoxin domain-containing protein [Gemmatimonadaceae bacterium]|nr:redoxin domain-containing protein [Gemmatimonadaceae bacterium]
MTARQQWGVVAAVVLLLGGALWAATYVLRDELFQVTVGAQAPAFQAVTLDQPRRERSISDYRGEVVLLNIWATWCAPCREEMPSIQALHERFAKQGLHVVAVSIDDPGSEAAIRDFAREYGLTFEILHDASGAIQRQYQTTGVPETVVIGRDGTIRKKQIGHADWNSAPNQALVEALLARR